MERSFRVSRIFPLGQYKNVTIEAAIKGEDLDAKEAIKQLIQEVYDGFFEHMRQYEALKQKGDEQ